MYNKFPKRTGIYHIKDNIDCFEFEIEFRQVNSLLNLPKFEWKAQTTTTTATTTTATTAATPAVEEEEAAQHVRVKWQEKIFSSQERELYKDENNCKTEQQQEYHQRILQEEEEAQQQQQSSSGKGKSKKRAKKAAKQQQLQQLQQKQIQQQLIYTHVQADDFRIEPPNTFETHSTATDMEHMYVYAALPSANVQLLTLRWHAADRRLYIYPDFNDMRDTPYYIELDTDYRQWYTYAVKHTSKGRSAKASDNASHCLPAACLPQWQRAETLTDEFEMPPQRQRRVALLLDLQTAEHFEYAPLHVRYRVQLPPHTLLEEGELSASTHSGEAAAAGKRTHLGYNWQLTILCAEEYANDAHPLHIYFEVISIDSWERERAEGYAHYARMLLLPGYEELQLQCLLPVESFWEAVERYFIGGRQKFDYRRFYTPQLATINTTAAESPTTSETSFSGKVENDMENVTKQMSDMNLRFQSRYHCRMRNTGVLYFSCRCITQRHAELLQPLKRSCGMTLDDIMLAYREARRRLEAVMKK